MSLFDLPSQQNSAHLSCDTSFNHNSESNYENYQLQSGFSSSDILQSFEQNSFKHQKRKGKNMVLASQKSQQHKHINKEQPKNIILHKNRNQKSITVQQLHELRNNIEKNTRPQWNPNFHFNPKCSQKENVQWIKSNKKQHLSLKGYNQKNQANACLKLYKKGKVNQRGQIKDTLNAQKEIFLRDTNDFNCTFHPKIKMNNNRMRQQYKSICNYH